MSAPCSHGEQSSLPHLVFSHRLASGKLLFRLAPALSTIFILNPITGASLFNSSLSLCASSPLLVCSTNRIVLVTGCSSSLFSCLPSAQLSCTPPPCCSSLSCTNWIFLVISSCAYLSCSFWQFSSSSSLGLSCSSSCSQIL